MTRTGARRDMWHFDMRILPLGVLLPGVLGCILYHPIFAPFELQATSLALRESPSPPRGTHETGSVSASVRQLPPVFRPKNITPAGLAVPRGAYTRKSQEPGVSQTDPEWWTRSVADPLVQPPLRPLGE